MILLWAFAVYFLYLYICIYRTYNKSFTVIDSGIILLFVDV